jgi:hypothetical protein
MSSTIHRTVLSSFRELDEQLQAEGFRPGLPDVLTPESVAIDRRLCARARCGRCHERGLQYRPYTNEDGLCRILASCPTCHSTEEF